MRIRIEGYGVPTTPTVQTADLRVGVQRLRDVEQLKALDTADLLWDLDATVHEAPDGSVDLRGPYVHGRRGDRFLYLAWGSLQPRTGALTMFRRAKLMLNTVDAADLVRADQPDLALTARLSLVGKDGTPVCAAVRPPAISWTVS